MRAAARRVFAAAAVQATVLAAGCRAPSGREARDFERMRQQQRYDPYEASAVFANRMVNQLPPAGTIARNGTPQSTAFLTGESSGQPVTTIPMPVNDSVLAVGAKHFRITCAACHGVAGFGGSVVAANMVEKRPPSLRTPHTRALPDGHIFAMISHGEGRMPAYDWQLTIAERWAVIAYLRALQASPVRDPYATADSIAAAALARQDSAARRDSAASVGRGKP